MEDICEKFFEGVLTKLPVYNVDTVAGDVMKYIGKWLFIAFHIARDFPKHFLPPLFGGTNSIFN